PLGRASSLCRIKICESPILLGALGLGVLGAAASARHCAAGPLLPVFWLACPGLPCFAQALVASTVPTRIPTWPHRIMKTNVHAPRPRFKRRRGKDLIARGELALYASLEGRRG